MALYKVSILDKKKYWVIQLISAVFSFLCEGCVNTSEKKKKKKRKSRELLKGSIPNRTSHLFLSLFSTSLLSESVTQFCLALFLFFFFLHFSQNNTGLPAILFLISMQRPPAVFTFVSSLPHYSRSFWCLQGHVSVQMHYRWVLSRGNLITFTSVDLMFPSSQFRHAFHCLSTFPDHITQ